MRSLTFTVIGEPVPQPRQRHRVIVPKGTIGVCKQCRNRCGHDEPGKPPFATNFTPRDDPVNLWKTMIQWAAQSSKPATPYVGPLLVDIEFYLARPQYMMTKKYPDGKVYHGATTDVDNLFKAVADALNTICYGDDRQICDGHSVKYYAEKTGQPRAVIFIQELT